MKIYDYPKIDLDRAGTLHQIPAKLDWAMLLHLAKIGGWQPRSDSFEQSYLEPSGEKVSAEEAVDIAHALEAILDDVPDFNIPLNGKLNPFEYFSGMRKRQITGLVTFCKGGAFRIT
jgi:hypothetical protein